MTATKFAVCEITENRRPNFAAFRPIEDGNDNLVPSASESAQTVSNPYG